MAGVSGSRLFSANTSGFSAPMPSALNSYSGAATISCWVYVTASSISVVHIGFGFIGQRGLCLGPTGTVNTTVWGGQAEGIGYISSGVTLATNQWFNLVITKPSGASSVVFSFYRNGGLDGTATSNYAATQTAGNGDTIFITMGAGNTHFKIADFAIWTVALTQPELSSLANYARPSAIRAGSLASWYPIDGQNSPEPDLSGKGLTATLTSPVAADSGPPVAPFTPRWPQPDPNPLYFTIRKQTRLNILQTGP